MPSYRLHYFPESGNSYKLALMLTLCGQEFEQPKTDRRAYMRELMRDKYRKQKAAKQGVSVTAAPPRR